jgi:hypothetical protein
MVCRWGSEQDAGCVMPGRRRGERDGDHFSGKAEIVAEKERDE